MARTTTRPSTRRRSAVRFGTTVAASAIVAATAATPALAMNTVANQNADTWVVNDAAIPGLDTGSIHNTSTGSLQGYGGLRMHVDNQATKDRGDGLLMRGFGLRFDGINRFSTTTAVGISGVSVSRSILINRADSWSRFVDSFTNTTKSAVTIQVAFGGQTGYNTGTNQSATRSTSSGDTTISPADTWTSVWAPNAAGTASVAGPSATVFGNAGATAAQRLTRTGNFLRDPFSVPLATTGDEANHPGYVNQLVIQPGQTRSLAHFVVTGLSETRTAPIVPPATTSTGVPAAGSQVTAVQTTAQSLAATPAFSDLSTAQICSIANFNVTAVTYPAGSSAADCGTAKAGEPAALPLNADPTPKTSSPYDVVGKTITELQADMASGKTTSQEITRAYLDRIAAYNGGPWGFHSMIAVAADAMAQAKLADVARANGIDKPLLGIPIAAKDIVDTKDMPTTGGSLVFDGYRPTKDAWQVTKYREAGAIILGKANLAEFATDGHFSPSAYGQVWNAFDPSKSSIGSSGGSAVSVATNMVAAAIGTQTGDSLWGPSSAASLVSLRGTDGMQSSDGVMPLTYIQDYVGTIAKSLPDLAKLLQASAIGNPDDPLDDVSDGHRPTDWASYLKADALQGKRIGVPATAFDDPFGTTGTSDAMRAQFANFTAAGATVKAITDPPPAPTRGDYGDTGYEGWLKWIQAHPDNPYTDVPQITQNQKRLPQFRAASTTYTGTGPMTDAQIKGFEAYRKNYRQILAAWMDDQGVDAVAFPGQLSDIHLNDSIQPSFGRRDPQGSAAGLPNVIFPAGVNDHGQPINLQLQGREYTDPELLGYAYAFEQVAKGHVETAAAPRLTYAPQFEAQPIVVQPLTPSTTTPGLPGSSEANATPGLQPPPATTPVKPVAPARKAGTLKVATSSVRATTAGRYVLRLSCAKKGTADCRVKVTVKRAGRTLSTKTLTVKAGATRSVTFTAPKAIRAILARGSKVTLKVSLKGVSGTKVAKVRTVTLTGAKR